MLQVLLRHCVAGALFIVTSGAGLAQTSNDPLNTSPRGATQLQPLRSGSVPAAATAATPAVALPPAVVAAPQTPLPPDPSTAQTPVVFGSQLFTGRLSAQSFSGFNPDYQIAVGDRITVRLWGAFNHEGTQTVDAQGNIFLPSVGPIQVLGVRNADLNRQVEAQVKRVFRSNVGMYATLEAAQPVKVYVTGFVRAPGLYGGLSSDSILYYLDKAGGIDPERGSHLEVSVMRGNQLRARLNLYDFLLRGQVPSLQLHDGDAIVAQPRQSTAQVTGQVLNPYVFEFQASSIQATDLLAMARPTPSATHLSIVRKVGSERRSEYHPLATAANVVIQNGDEVTVTADKYPGTILVRVEGANLSERTLVMPYGARLRDAVARLRPAPQANMEALQLFRRSVAIRQKETLETSLRSLETYALTARSATSEEAALRSREAELILQFIERARNVEPRGQVILANKDGAADTLLEDGDILRLPERSNLVLVSGEVLFPTALVHDPRAGIEDYVREAGGYTQDADAAKLVMLRQDGSVASADSAPQPGDEIMVLPKIETKRVEITRGITQILYQLAVAAKVVFGL